MSKHIRFDQWLLDKYRHLRLILSKANDLNQNNPEGAVLQEESTANAALRPKLSHSFTFEGTSLKKLKVAAIMDRFTLECFRPECQLMELTPENWEEEMEAFLPDLLFIESAWEGKNSLWRGKVNHCSIELYNLTEYCHKKNIPVVFWNKEDPVYTDTFLTTAKRADFVFTTDIECIEKYKTELGHDRVYHLHFAAQPKIHNPIEKYDRKDRFCFAGAYYHRYKDRCRVFDAFSEYFINSRGFDIYDRNYLNAKPEHKFPEQYDPYILGNLDPSEIDIAYKGYVYGINMNSVTQSQTMFARRVFELMASNTLVVGNYSRGVKNYFGDLTFCTDDEKTLRKSMEQYCGTGNSVDKLRLLALRKVLSEHLVEDRLDYIVQKTFHLSAKRQLPVITVYSCITDPAAADRVITMYQNQRYTNKKLILVSENPLQVPDHCCVMTPDAFLAGNLAEDNGFFAYFSAHDWYGKNYLLDLALTTRYGDFDVIGKAEYFTTVDGMPIRTNRAHAYHIVSELTARRCMISAAMVTSVSRDLLSPDHTWKSTHAIAIDAMNYCESWQDDLCPEAEDMILSDQGISMSAMELAAKKIEAAKPSADTCRVSVDELERLRIPKDSLVNLERRDAKLLLHSDFSEGTYQYFFLDQKIEITNYLKEGKLNVLFRGETAMDLTGCCIFFDKDNNKISRQNVKIGIRCTIVPPPETAYIKLSYRVCGPGNAMLRDVELGANIVNSLRGNCFLPRSNVLVLTNHYPAPDNLYRNMFVHKRLTAYKQLGKNVDVMRMYPYLKDCVREFEGVNILEGSGDMLDIILNSGTIDTVCVHFLSEDMWSILQKYQHSVRILIWLHGADIQPWWRRSYIYKNEQELAAGKIVSDKRMAFWKEVFASAMTNCNLHFVFVSQYFADEVFTDYEVTLPKEKYSVIHNFIDTDQFSYLPKKPEDRKKILSIRPYSSTVYANDLTVKALLEITKESWFNDLDIALYGRGPLFHELLQPLKEYPNIHIEEKFFTQSEIAAMHKSYGIFLTPSRTDTQGVSRDEAMSSGLVPITNAVAAIPEFVNDNCGILAENEDYLGIAAAIKQLYFNPDLYTKMSENAAKRVRSQTSREYTIRKELQLIEQGISGHHVSLGIPPEIAHPFRLN